MVSSDEKLLAAIGYWGGLVLSMVTGILGFVPALIIYLMKKDESVFVRKQSLQALVLHIAIVVIVTVLWVFGAVFGAITAGLGFLLFIPFMILFGLAMIVYLIYLGVKVFQGEDVNIPYLTNFINKNLGGTTGPGS
jgi:uncharacterized protein